MCDPVQDSEIEEGVPKQVSVMGNVQEKYSISFWYYKIDQYDLLFTEGYVIHGTMTCNKENQKALAKFGRVDIW